MKHRIRRIITVMLAATLLMGEAGTPVMAAQIPDVSSLAEAASIITESSPVTDIISSGGEDMLIDGEETGGDQVITAGDDMPLIMDDSTLSDEVVSMDEAVPADEEGSADDEFPADVTVSVDKPDSKSSSSDNTGIDNLRNGNTVIYEGYKTDGCNARCGEDGGHYSCLVDGDKDTRCICYFDGEKRYIDFHSIVPIIPVSYILTTADDWSMYTASSPKDWRVLAKRNKDDAEWTVLDNVEGNETLNDHKVDHEFPITNTGTWQYFRFEVSKELIGDLATGFTLAEFMFRTPKSYTTLSANDITVFYNAAPVSDDQITGTATLSGNNIPGTWSFAPEQNLTNVDDSGEKTVIFTPDDPKYPPASTTINLKINKAELYITKIGNVKTFPNDLPSSYADLVTVEVTGLQGQDTLESLGFALSGNYSSGDENGHYPYLVPITGEWYDDISLFPVRRNYDCHVDAKGTRYIVEKPTPVSGLIYDGKPHKLLKPYNGNVEILYLKGSSGNWDDKIPERTDAGTYYIYFMCPEEGFANHYTYNEKQMICIEIAKAAHADVEVSTGVMNGRATNNATLTLPELPEGASYASTGTVSGTTSFVKGTPRIEGRTLTYSTNKKDAGTEATITISVTGAKNYEDYKLKVHVRAYDDNIWIDDIPAQDYTGSAVKPAPVVHYRSMILSPRDYTVSYKNNTNAAKKDADKAPTVTVTGKGNYTGTAKKTFTINALDLRNATAPDILLTANNNTQYGKTKVTYTLNGKTITLKDKSDYTLSYPDTSQDAYKRPGKYKVKVTGKGNYKGTTEFMETIAEKKNLISKVTVPSIPAQAYDGKAFVLEDTQVRGYETRVLDKNGAPFEFKLTVKDGRNTIPLIYGEDYELTYSNNREIGTATVTITGKRDYAGTKTTTFKINGTKFSGIKNDGKFKSSFEYDNGNPIRQTEYDDNFYFMEGKTKHYLEKTRDYSVTYRNNRETGTATVVYTGMGKYTGSVKKTFKITGTPMNKVTVPSDFGISTKYRSLYDAAKKKFIYTGEPFCVAGPENAESYTEKNNYGIELKDKGYVLKNGEDYTVSYQKNTEPGTASVTFTGKGKYTGTVKKTFGIRAYDVEDNTGGSIKVMHPLDKNPNKEWKALPGATASDVPSYNFIKGGLKPEPVVKYTYDGQTIMLEKGRDYTLSWSNNTKPGAFNAESKGKSIAPKVTITFKGRFSGKPARTFTINTGVMKEFQATDIVYQKEKTGLYKKTRITITDESGQELKSGTDYFAMSDKNKPFVFKFAKACTVTYKDPKTKKWESKNVSKGSEIDPAWCIPAGAKINVTVYGKGCYEGQSITGSFYFGANDLSKAAVTIPGQYYKGEAYSKSEIGKVMKVALKVNGEIKELTYDTDFTISYLQDKADVGTVNVTIKGNPANGCAGEKKATFKIVSRSF
ncbi:MAG: hypothetical protein IKP31_04440 [Lachnospiraceae bacterium]|nr:hypothetical protein [Lachnospiraceae bacterium]